MFVELVIARGRGIDLIGAEQIGRGPRVLAGDEIGLFEHAERPEGQILQIADRRRNEIQGSAHVPLLFENEIPYRFP